MNLSETVECIKASLENRDDISEKLSHYEWCKKYYYIKGEPFNLEGREYLRDIYLDDHKYIVIQKAAQVGCSEWALSRCFWFIDRFKENPFYAFPTKDGIGDFVQSRIDPRILESSYLSSNITKTNNIKIKKYKNNFIFLRGGNSQNDLLSSDAGFLIIDEVDRWIQRNVELAYKRLGASKYGFIAKLSTPTHKDFGINYDYPLSDQREYYNVCPKCKKYQILNFFENVYPKPNNDPYQKYNEVYFCCKYCDAKIDNKKPGKWIAKYPGREIHGYKVPKLLGKTAKELFKSYKDALKKGGFAVIEFFNSDLAEPFDQKGGQLTDVDLNACIDDEPVYNIRNCYMGVDIGNKINVVIKKRERDETLRIVHLATYDEFEELDTLMKTFDVWVCVVDGLPEGRASRDFANRFEGRVWLAYYNLQDSSQVYAFDDDKEEGKKSKALKVRINRTNACDLMVNNIINRVTRFNRKYKDVQGFYEQMKAPKKVKEKNEKTGDVKFVYLEGNKADHYFHASVYCDIASNKSVYVSPPEVNKKYGKPIASNKVSDRKGLRIDW